MVCEGAALGWGAVFLHDDRGCLPEPGRGGASPPTPAVRRPAGRSATVSPGASVPPSSSASGGVTRNRRARPGRGRTAAGRGRGRVRGHGDRHVGAHPAGLQRGRARGRGGSGTAAAVSRFTTFAYAGILLGPGAHRRRRRPGRAVPGSRGARPAAAHRRTRLRPSGRPADGRGRSTRDDAGSRLRGRPDRLADPSADVDVDDLDGVVAVAEPVPRRDVGLDVAGRVGRAGAQRVPADVGGVPVERPVLPLVGARRAARVAPGATRPRR